MYASLSEVLVIEDDSAIAETCRAYLARGGYTCKVLGMVAAAIEELERTPYPLVLLDLTLPDGSGMQVLDYLQSRLRLRETAVTIITADATMRSAMETLQHGAYDYIVKPFNSDRLLTTLGNARNTLSLQSTLTKLREEVNRERFGDFIGGSVQMQLVYRIIESAASSRATVFITGESGTGKEIAARCIHQQSRRSSGPFVAINCAAIPRDLMESELFGHVKGAFAGASADRMGAVERALGGTLFLDEICEMPMELQPKWLRFLQGNMYRPVGGNDMKTTNCWIICATHLNPQMEIENGRFREDLYYRLHVLPLHLPALREHREDIMPIAMDALRKFSAEEDKEFTRLSADAQRTFQNYDWPGNVRQLLNVIRQIVVLNGGAEITRGMLPSGIEARMDLMWRPTAMQAVLETEQMEYLSQHAANAEQPIQPLWQVERQAIEVPGFFDGNVQLAADALQINPTTIHRKRLEWSDAQEQVAG